MRLSYRSHSITNALALLAALGLLLIFTGCAAAKPSPKAAFPAKVHLSSEPEGAKIIARTAAAEQSMGLSVVAITPAQLTILGPVTVVLHKKGFAPLDVNIGAAKSIKVTLEPVAEDPVYDEIWWKDSFQGAPLSFADESLRRRAYLADSPNLPLELRRAILAGEPLEGMTTEQARATLGPPQGIITREDALGRRERWIYPTRQLSFENGLLKSWND